MFWKREKSENGPDGCRSPRGGRSIVRRLTLLNILAVLIGYLLFGWMFYRKQVHYMQRAEAVSLAEEIVSVKTMLQAPNGIELLRHEMSAQLYEPDSARLFIRILDAEGRTLLESPGMAKVLPVSAFDGTHGHRKCYGTIRWRNPDGDRYLLKTASLPGVVSCRAGCSLQVATSSNDQTKYKRELRSALVLFIAGGVVFTFVCGLFIVRLSLRPVEEISNTARSITRKELHTRIDETLLPVELRSMAQSFNAMLARLNDSFQRLSHYSANLAHELRTPINSLTLAAEVSLSRERSAEEYRAVISSSVEEFGRLSWIIDRMLFLARADNEQLDLEPGELEAGEEIDNVLDYFSETAREAGVALSRQGAGSVFADLTLFRSAVTNLVSNGLAHTAAGGAVSVSVREGAAGTEVTVADTGCGIEQQHMARIFDRFYRAPGAGQARRSGHGLGLAIVKAIMDLHAGSVVIASAPGIGTTVTLCFPRNAAASAPLDGGAAKA